MKWHWVWRDGQEQVGQPKEKLLGSRSCGTSVHALAKGQNPGHFPEVSEQAAWKRCRPRRQEGSEKAWANKSLG